MNGKYLKHGRVAKAMDLHKVKNELTLIGMSDPPFPLIFGALYNATGKWGYWLAVF